MRWILDLDDTLANTTLNMQGDESRVSELTLAAGAKEFLALLKSRGDFHALVTVGREEVQKAKIGHLGLVFDDIAIVPKGDNPSMKSEAIARLASEGGTEAPCVLVGDRLDRDISVGNSLGLTTVRMCLREGRYSLIEPQNELEKPTHSVADFFELMKLPLFP
jgi:FMN phosphatase YigB (HAD superfamily)